MSRRRIAIVLLVAASVTVSWSPAVAFVVIDPLTVARNAVTAALKSDILEVLTEQQRRFKRMARRLSVFTDLAKYAVPDVPRWRVYRYQDSNLYANPYVEALNYGDPAGAAFDEVSRLRASIDAELARLHGESPAAAAAIAAQLATLDVADSTLIAGTDLNGRLRPLGKAQMRVIDKLEADVVDPSGAQSTTAVLDKISAASLVGARQKQSRLQFMIALVEQLALENKRSRDTEAAVMNMQLERLRLCGESGGFLTGAGNALRTWRQP
jgi:hypothetical protein